MTSICIRCGKADGEVHPSGKMDDPFYVGICISCGGDVYKPMTTAVCYFTEAELYKCKKKPTTLFPLLEEAIEDLYANYQKVYYGRLLTIYRNLTRSKGIL